MNLRAWLLTMLLGPSDMLVDVGADDDSVDIRKSWSTTYSGSRSRRRRKQLSGFGRRSNDADHAAVVVDAPRILRRLLRCRLARPVCPVRDACSLSFMATTRRSEVAEAVPAPAMRRAPCRRTPL